MSKASTTVPKLYAQFEQAHAAYRAIPTTVNGELSNPAFDRAVERCGKIADKIARTSARNVAEVLIKLRVAAWGADNRSDESLSRLDYWQPGRLNSGAEWATIASVRDDLERMFGALDPEPVSADGKFQKPLTGVAGITAAFASGAPPRALLQAAQIYIADQASE